MKTKNNSSMTLISFNEIYDLILNMYLIKFILKDLYIKKYYL